MSKTLPHFDEQNVLTQAAQGDERAFKLIFDAYQPRVYTFALHYLKSAHQAEEAVQEVFVKLWRKGSALADINNLEQYIFMVTRNHALDCLRRRSVRANIHVPLQDTHDAPTTDTEDTILLHDTRRLLEEGIANLPPQQQRVYRLCRQHGLTYQQVAQQLSLSDQTVQRHMKLALRFLRNYLEKNGAAGVLLLVLKLF